MRWRPWLEPAVLRQMRGLPPEAWDMLVRTLARICDDPYDRLHSAPLENRPRDRLAELGDSGFLEFTISESEGLVRVYRLVWAG